MTIRARFGFRALLLGASLWATRATAQAPTFAGSYKAGPMREDYTVESWKPEWCGPSPQSSVTNGGTIEIKIEGDELVFGGDRRGFKTSGCYEPLPSLTRQTHSKDLARGVWTTHCSTPAQDPRKAVVDTTVTANASSGKIDLVETAKFELVVKEGTCVARLSRRQSLQRVGTVPAVTAAPPADVPKPADPRMDCSSPGPIERIEVTPRERSLRAGDTFTFRSIARDAKGCALPHLPARFLFVSADPNVNVTAEPGGKVVVAGESKEGRAKLRVEIGGKETHVDITVVSRAQYEDLLRRHVPSVDTTEEGTNLVQTSTVQTTPNPQGASRTWVYLVLAGVGFLGIVGAVLLRKRKGAGAHSETEPAHTDVMPNVIHSRAGEGFSGSTGFTGVGERSSVSKLGSTMVLGAFRDDRGEGGKPSAETLAADEEWICPTCLAPREKNATFCSKDGSRVVPASSIDRGAPQHACPICRRSFGAGVAICPEHGESLVPIRTLAMPKIDTPKNVTKVCPKCGAKYGANVVYCGVDGETLALLN